MVMIQLQLTAELMRKGIQIRIHSLYLKLNSTKLDSFPIRLSHDDDKTRIILMEGNIYVLS